MARLSYPISRGQQPRQEYQAHAAPIPPPPQAHAPAGLAGVQPQANIPDTDHHFPGHLPQDVVVAEDDPATEAVVLVVVPAPRTLPLHRSLYGFILNH